MCGKCMGRVWEVLGKCTGSVGGSFFGSGWECRIERKHLWNGALRRFKEVLSCANLRRRELNPGLPRDRRKYSPLYYSGHVKEVVKISSTDLHFACFCSLRGLERPAWQPPLLAWGRPQCARRPSSWPRGGWHTGIALESGCLECRTPPSPGGGQDRNCFHVGALFYVTFSCMLLRHLAAAPTFWTN